MKSVTDRKLVAASRALIALAECEDLDVRADAACQALYAEGRWPTHVMTEFDNMYRPSSDRFVRIANLLSRMLSEAGTPEAQP